MHLRWSRILVGVFCLLLALLVVLPAQACDTVEQCADEIKKITHDLTLSIQATTPLESEVQKLAGRLQSIQNSIVQLEREQKQKEIEIQAQETVLADQYKLFSNRVDQQYRYSRTYSPLVVLLTSSRTSQGSHALKYALTLAERDKQSIDSVGQNILDLQRAKTDAAAKAKQLAGLKIELDKQKAFFEKEIAGAKKYQQTLQGQIAVLTARQQAILAQKTGTAQTTVGDVPLADDPNSRPDYNPGFSPAFAAFSFGAPHFKGMSQYGAYGRAKSGQNYESILKTYYGDVEIKKDYDQNKQIHVVGCTKEGGDAGPGACASKGGSWIDDTISLEKYAARIYEMPSSWGDNGGMDALKAQAIAARSYALARTAEGSRSICPNQGCQVYKSSDKGGNWQKAVDETKGHVVFKNGKPVSTWYSSTSGGHLLSYTDSNAGHTTPALWDTTSEWTRWADGAYEKIADSPWFYKGWYKSGSDACGRNHPWLNQEEMADILNALVIKRKGGSDFDRVSPIGPCWGGNPYSLSEMREKAKSFGEEYTAVSSVRVEHGNNGYTSKVVFGTNRGEVSISGSEFKEIFNLRAPGRISIKSTLFDLRQR